MQRPCLVEINCRAHGGNANWRSLCTAVTGGFSQIEGTADAYLDPEGFANIPSLPPSRFKAFGQECMLVSYASGQVKSSPGFDVIRQLPSFICFETGIKPGSKVDYTIDLITCVGSVILMHKDKSVVQRDVEFIRYVEKINGLFMFETKAENLQRPRGDLLVVDQYSPKKGEQRKPRHQRVFSSDGPSLIRHMSNDRPELRGPLIKRMTTVDSSKECVVLVDPYSTGCCIALEIMKRGFTVIALWTKNFAPEMKTHVPLSCGVMKYFAEIEEAETLVETVQAVHKAADQKRVVACIAGGEAGVDLADALSERLSVRTNGTSIPNRRDKKLQQELIRKSLRWNRFYTMSAIPWFSSQ
jgi:hypothetical protein